MKKLLLPIVVVLPFEGQAQFSSGTVNLNAANMTVKLDVDAVKVKLKVTGADNSMLGIGFGSQGMANGSFGFIFSSNANNDFIFKGSGNNPIPNSNQGWTIDSNLLQNGNRVIVASRLLANNNAYPFTNAAGNLSIYYAKNQGSMAIENHGSHRGYATLNMQAISIDTSTSIDDKSIESEVSIFPNPAQNNIFVKSENYPVQRLVVYTLSGKKVYASYQNNIVETGNLPIGNYVLEIELLNQKVIYKKFSKQ